jgi:hypothetical protein
MKNKYRLLIVILICTLPVLSICQTTDQAKTYTIIASSDKHGSITPSGIVTVARGGTQAFSIKPDAGYHIERLLIDGSVVDQDSSYTFENVSFNHTINARFASDKTSPSSSSAGETMPDSITIYARATEHGAISPSGAVKVKRGGNQGFKIEWDSGYHIDSLFIDSSLVTSDDSYSFMNVTADHFISVKFTFNSYTIAVESGPNGTITPEGKISLPQGEQQSFTIVPAAGYHIKEVIVDGMDQGVVENYTFTNITVNHNIRAEFAKDE